MPPAALQPRSLAPEVPFRYIGGDPALDLANTVDWTHRGLEHDRLSDYGRLLRWAEGAGAVPAPVAARLRQLAPGRPREAAAALDEARRVRAVLNHLFTTLAREGRTGPGLDRFNRVLTGVLRHQRLAPVARRRRTHGAAAEWSWAGLGDELESVLWPVVWSAASLLVSTEAARIRVCGGPDCGWLYVDRSRNGLRRWCQMETCGTREKTRRRRGRTAGMHLIA
jgi:predicted RNA-binding Zn ribbon-like protein